MGNALAIDFEFVQRDGSMNDKSNHLGARIRKLRKTRGLTQSQLAEKAGLKGQGYISEIEAGVKGLPSDTIEKVADALGVSPAELWGEVIPKGADQIPQIMRFSRGEYRELQEYAKEFVYRADVESFILHALAEFKRNHPLKEK